VIAALGLLVGIVLGLFFQPNVPLGLEPYLPIAVVAALDAVFGGGRPDPAETDPVGCSIKWK